MKMEVHLQHRLEQRLQLSQQMLQNLEMLQKPILELRQAIDEELSKNPALDLASETEERPAEPPADTKEEKEEAAKTEFLESVEEELFQAERRARPSGGDDGDRRQEFLQSVGAPEATLRDYLTTQLGVQEIDPELKPYLVHLISNLNDIGYLGSSLEEIAQALPEELKLPAPEATRQRLEAALSFLQKMEPAGVGARDTKECLLLQLDETDPGYAAKRRIIEIHLGDIGHNRLPKIARDLMSDPQALTDFGYRTPPDTAVLLEDLKIWIAEIQKLNPKPGANFATENAPRVFPEVLIRRVDGTYEIVIEDSWIPPLTINRDYQDRVKDKTVPKTERDSLRHWIDAGRKLISALEQRRQTIQRITGEILKHQLDFFEHGAEHLKPLKMQEVADALGIHNSTVSRAISGKWIETPRGIFPMKFFFASAAPKSQTPGPSQPVPAGSADPDDRTRLALMEKIRDIVDGEDRKRPLSDLEIVRILKQQGITAARRTVAKYREEMNIPSSRLRRQY
ncbi:MAG TPA: RNA polymerase factor sigma-54 [Planctomycetota bacterium]|nr:RNA polymerase factor sigma-54 [Planctomycetota bacterium]